MLESCTNSISARMPSTRMASTRFGSSPSSSTSIGSIRVQIGMLTRRPRSDSRGSCRRRGHRRCGRLAQQRLREMQRQDALADAARSADQQRVRPASRASAAPRPRACLLPRQQRLPCPRERVRVDHRAAPWTASPALRSQRLDDRGSSARTASGERVPSITRECAGARRARAADTSSRTRVEEFVLPRARTCRARGRPGESSWRATSTADVEEQREIGPEVAEDQPLERAIALPRHAVAAALVGVGRVGEAIADDPHAAASARPDHAFAHARAAPRTSAALRLSATSARAAAFRAALRRRECRRARGLIHTRRPARSMRVLEPRQRACSCRRRRCLRA